MSNCRVGTRVSLHARHPFPRLGPISTMIFVVSPQPLLFERGWSIVSFKSVTLTLLKSCRNFWQCWTLFLIVVGAVLVFHKRTLHRHLSALHLLRVTETLRRLIVAYDSYYLVYLKKNLIPGHVESNHCTISSHLLRSTYFPQLPISQVPLVHVLPLMEKIKFLAFIKTAEMSKFLYILFLMNLCGR